MADTSLQHRVVIGGGVVVPLYKKGDRRVCSNYRGITLLSLPGKVYSKVLERALRPMVLREYGFGVLC